MAQNIIITGRICKRMNEYSAGDRFDRLMLTGKSFRNKTSHIYFECICDCGNICFVVGNNLRIGKTTSCGCKKATHGLSKHPLYKTWRNVLKRCYYIKGVEYNDYGGRGIKVCEEWVDDFYSFYTWSINNGWGDGLTLDREDNDGNYKPNNCRWITNSEQQRNKRNNFIITAFGETKCLQDWENDKRCSVSNSTIKCRIDKGWTAEDAISKPNSNLTENRKQRKDVLVVDYMNQSKTLTEWCNLMGLNYLLIRGRLADGWDVKTAFDTECMTKYYHNNKKQNCGKP